MGAPSTPRIFHVGLDGTMHNITPSPQAHSHLHNTAGFGSNNQFPPPLVALHIIPPLTLPFVFQNFNSIPLMAKTPLTGCSKLNNFVLYKVPPKQHFA